MSAMGQKQTLAAHKSCLLWANSGHRAQFTMTAYSSWNATFLADGPTSKPWLTQIGWSPLHKNEVENAYSSTDRSFLAFARCDLASGINSGPSRYSPCSL